MKIGIRKWVWLAVMLLLNTGGKNQACTTAIISGKFTVDGRPLLLKHRDTDAVQNKMVYLKDGQYDYIGLADSPDSTLENIWAGMNHAGFAIMNSASYNLNLADTTKSKDQEGKIMKLALQRCATVTDFEILLQQLPRPMGVEANFGVIDAQGGAAYFETGNFEYVKVDANDPIVAPFGYLIRTNHSFAQAQNQGYGYIRYLTAENLLYQAVAMNDLSVRFLLQDVSRCLKHSLTGVDLTQQMPRSAQPPQFVWFEDFIPRKSSTATTIVQGVKNGEAPGLTTLWEVLGFPLCSVAVPVWMAGGEQLPRVLMADASGNAPLCDYALQLKARCFPIGRGSGYKYLNLAALINQEQTGILQKLRPLEDHILAASQQKLTQWRSQGIKTSEVRNFYRWLDETIQAGYQRLFEFRIHN
ncbi:C45 family peptidase [candidate division KSB1 bacterium]|nr:C45 family peptidase [candidate division KSB1 bacterium]